MQQDESKCRVSRCVQFLVVVCRHNKDKRLFCHYIGPCSATILTTIVHRWVHAFYDDAHGDGGDCDGAGGPGASDFLTIDCWTSPDTHCQPLKPYDFPPRDRLPRPLYIEPIAPRQLHPDSWSVQVPGERLRIFVLRWLISYLLVAIITSHLTVIPLNTYFFQNQSFLSEGLESLLTKFSTCGWFIAK